MRNKKKNKELSSANSVTKKLFTQTCLVCAAMVIAFAFYFWVHRDSDLGDQSPQQSRAVRKNIKKKTFSISQPQEYSDHTTENTFRQSPKENIGKIDVSPPLSRRDETVTEPHETSEQDPITSVAENRLSSEMEVPSEKPEYSDAMPPKLIALWFDPAEAQPGTNVVVHAQATDDLSGVQSVWGNAKSPSGMANVHFSCKKSEGNESFIGVINIPEKAETGKWLIEKLRLTDKVANAKTYTMSDAVMHTAGFKVIGSTSDNKAPIILDINIDPPEVRGGEKVYLVVHVKDDQAGVARVDGSLTSPSNNAKLSIACQKAEEENVFTGYTVIPKDAESGEWVLRFLWTEDAAKNSKMYYRSNYPQLFEQATVRIYGEYSDAQPPTLEGLTISPDAVAYGEAAEIVVSAIDDVSGISQVYGRLQSPSKKARLAFTCGYNSETDTYRARMTIKNNSEVGFWTVEYIRLVDKARNDIVLGLNNEIIANATLEVTGE